MASTENYTVWHAFYDILRNYGMTTMFGNPGSTEQPMLKNFPSDFKYILGLQEASVVGMAGGYSEATRKPVVVSLHTSAGTGNAMGTIMTAFMNKIPLILIAGQQTREMLLGEPLLANRDATNFPRPYVKWSYQPDRAVDVPAALIRGIAHAMQPPAGPVYLSIPLDDWDVDALLPLPPPRMVSTRVAPDPEQLQVFAARIAESKKPALMLGPEVDRSLAWDAAVTLAEFLGAPVFQAPFAERAVFPETHELYKGSLPPARGPLAKILEHFDLVIVIGAEVFRYYPWVAGPVLPPGTKLLQITNDPNDAAKALVGDSLLSDVSLAMNELNRILQSDSSKRSATHAKEHPNHNKELLASHKVADTTGRPMTAYEAFDAAAASRPSNAILVQESPSNYADLVANWPSLQPEHFFTMASGGLGWNAPAAAGIALAQKETSKPTVLVIGDGSLQYSVQSIWSAVQQKVKLVYLVPVNDDYTILKEFAVLENAPNVPGLDLPGLHVTAIAEAYGCRAFTAKTPKEVQQRFQEALQADGPTLIAFPIDRTLRPLIAQSKPGA